MAEDAVSTIGTDLKLGTTGQTPTFASIDGITSINGFGTTRSEIDTTTLKSGSKSFMLGLKDNGTLQIESLYNPDVEQHGEIRGLNDTGEKRRYQLVLSDTDPATTFEFDGYVSSWALRAEVDNVYRCTYSIRITGDIEEN